MDDIFVAAFDSECALCDGLVEKGQEARMLNEAEGTVAHARCPDRVQLKLVFSG